MSSISPISISDNFPIWLGRQLKEAIHPQNIDSVAQRIFVSLPQPLQDRSEPYRIFSIRLQQTLNFLDMFQTPDEKRFIGRIQELTPHKNMIEALPALYLMVLITNASVYPPQMGHNALLEILGPNTNDFQELQTSLLVPSLDTVAPRIVEKLYALSQQPPLLLGLAQWIEGQRLFSFLDATSLYTLLDEIPTNLSPYTLVGYKGSLRFLRERLQNSFEVKSITEINLEDKNYPNTVVEGLPAEIALFSHLKKLTIQSRDIHTLPPALAQCQELEEIHFLCAASNGYIPIKLGYLPKIRHLVTRENVLVPSHLMNRTDRNFTVVKLPKK
ncbi:MAG: hypothetical protein WCP39_01180 [Chlamydiota bacterium]